MILAYCSDIKGANIYHIFLFQIFLTFIVAAIMILAYCSDIKGANTYQDVVRTVCGKNAQRASAMFLTTYCFGTCITFLIIIGDQWEDCKYWPLILLSQYLEDNCSQNFNLGEILVLCRHFSGAVKCDFRLNV